MFMHVKGTVSQDFQHSFLSKTSPGPIWTSKNGFAKFFVSRRHSRKTCVRVVIDYADAVSAEMLTALTPCWRSRWLRGHDVGVVVKSFDISTCHFFLTNLNFFFQLYFNMCKTTSRNIIGALCALCIIVWATFVDPDPALYLQARRIAMFSFVIRLLN